MHRYSFQVEVHPQYLPEQSDEKIRGLGVVGHQPLLKPGEQFEYTSGTRLRTPTGTMHGSYFCVAEDGEKFDVDIPMFVLDALSNDPSKRNLH